MRINCDLVAMRIVKLILLTADCWRLTACSLCELKRRNMNIKTIKADLRQLKKTIHIIEALKRSQARYTDRIDTLSKFVQTPKIKEQIETTKKVMSLLKIEDYIKEANELEKKYISAINKLEPLEKTIIIESFLNGKPYWKIGNELGYEEETIRKKIAKILRKIASCLTSG